MFHGELSFLNDIQLPKNGFREAYWLLSPFEDLLWQADLSLSSPLSWSFDIGLYDGSRLSDKKHSEMLDTFKQWICIQTHPSVNKNHKPHPSTARNRIVRTLHLIDYILLSGHRLRIAEFGLKLLTANDLRSMVSEIASFSGVEISIYQWPYRLKSYLLESSRDISGRLLREACDDAPELEYPFEGGDAVLGLSFEELLRVRAWLWHQGLYRRRLSASGTSYVPDLATVGRAIYANTLWGLRWHSMIPELGLGEEQLLVTEKARVPTGNFGDVRGLDRCLSIYVSSLHALKKVCAINQAAPLSSFDALDDVLASLDLKEPCRYTMLPQQVVLKSLRASIEFALEYGDELIDAYLRIATAAYTAQEDFHQTATRDDFSSFLGPKLRRLGVKRWAIHSFGSMEPLERSEYFQMLRQNIGLYELLRVLVGSVFLCVGTLMARRVGELSDLKPRLALDELNRYLLFDNRKTGTHGLRLQEARPIPHIAVVLIQMLQRMHAGLAGTHFSADAPLFSHPTRCSGQLVTSKNRMYCCLDAFCDYFELEGADAGSRYYVRQHQLRQFFAIAFFWSAGFGGVDTLRWFLGHMDVKHLWHYITRSVPGEILRHVKVEYALENVRRGSPNAEPLAELMLQRFGTRNFALVESEQLERYIGALLDEGKVHIEPEFLKDDSGTKYRILIKVIDPLEKKE